MVEYKKSGLVCQGNLGRAPLSALGIFKEPFAVVLMMELVAVARNEIRWQQRF